MELPLSIPDEGAVGSTVALPVGVKPCKGSLTGFNAQDSFSHAVLGERKGLAVGAEADFCSTAHVVFASPRAAAVVCPDVVALAAHGKGVPKAVGMGTHGAALPRSGGAGGPKVTSRDFRSFRSSFLWARGRQGCVFLPKWFEGICRN